MYFLQNFYIFFAQCIGLDRSPLKTDCRSRFSRLPDHCADCCCASHDFPAPSCVLDTSWISQRLLVSLVQHVESCSAPVHTNEYKWVQMSTNAYQCNIVQHFEVMLVLLRSDIVADLLENHIDCASEALSSIQRHLERQHMAIPNLFQRL